VIICIDKEMSVIADVSRPVHLKGEVFGDDISSRQTEFDIAGCVTEWSTDSFSWQEVWRFRPQLLDGLYADSLPVAPYMPGRFWMRCRTKRWAEMQRAGRSRDRNTVLTRVSAPVHTGPGAHPVSYTIGTGLFPGE
jgi:hypothetical protein